MTDHAVIQSDKMACRKSPAARLSVGPLFPSTNIRSGGDAAPAKAKPQDSVSTQCSPQGLEAEYATDIPCTQLDCLRANINVRIRATK